MTDKSRWIHLPKRLYMIGDLHETDFYEIKSMGSPTHHANDVLKAMGLEQITISRDGDFDTYNLPEKWKIERYDDNGFRITIRKKEGIIALENAHYGKYGLHVKAPTDKKYEDLQKLVCKPGEILVPRYWDRTWLTDGHHFDGIGSSLGNVPNSKKYVYESLLYDYLNLENIPYDEQQNLGEKVLSEFFRAKLPEGSSVSFESKTLSNQLHKKIHRLDTLVAQIDLEGTIINLSCQFWPGWYFGGKKRNSKMMVEPIYTSTKKKEL